MSLFMITQRVYPSIHQAIYINLSGITSEIECSLLSSSKVSIRMGQLLLFIFTFFYYFYKTDEQYALYRLILLRESSWKLRLFIDIFVLSLAQPVESVSDANLHVFFKRRAPDVKYRPWI